MLDLPANASKCQRENGVTNIVYIIIYLYIILRYIDIYLSTISIYLYINILLLLLLELLLRHRRHQHHRRKEQKNKPLTRQHQSWLIRVFRTSGKVVERDVEQVSENHGFTQRRHTLTAFVLLPHGFRHFECFGCCFLS